MTTTPAGRPEPEQAMLKAIEDIAQAGPWCSSSRSTIEVLESEDWARVTINVNASKLIGPKVKRYLLAMAPDNVRALVESTASLRAENERLQEEGVRDFATIAAQARRIAELEAALQEFLRPFDGDAIDEIEVEYGIGTAQRIDKARALLASSTLQPEHKGV